jgi:phospholipid/cholesterol/gamma-HCH transport system substrate-binding protein
MENKAHALAAGAFVLGVVALLVALAIWLTRDSGTQNLYEISTSEAVSGLQPQATVRFRGIAVGKVAAIGFDPKTRGNVLVQLSVDDGAPITKSTFAQLSYQGVTGLAFVQLDDATPGSPPLPPDNSNPPRLPLKPSLLSKLTDQGEKIVQQVEETTRRINTLLGPDNQKALMGAVTEISGAAQGVKQLTANVDKLIGDQLSPDKVNIPQLARQMGQTMTSLEKAADDVSKTADEAGKTARRLNEKDGPIDRLAEGTEGLSKAADSFNAATLPRVNRVTEETSRAVRRLSRTVNNINDNPQSLIFGNGAVNPGPGEPGFVAPGGAQK